MSGIAVGTLLFAPIAVEACGAANGGLRFRCDFGNDMPAQFALPTTATSLSGHASVMFSVPDAITGLVYKGPRWPDTGIEQRPRDGEDSAQPLVWQLIRRG